ncbi:endonuclease/exonuclease/phosphatase family protein [Gimesia aquarii]|uniref:Endonuclease/Exonuclease/phosphatase family protein n=1 Tax=Gimesia aquarii TaxID=2527964 RepID=A0A517WU74_9PLAN|nr:endonuclease/exonuclease/phosphatase family protein [Gimesia aquarii]QDU08758.1 Endonuclease/Exonuclease/phosphatase family protein [Gimesia aquarii]
MKSGEESTLKSVLKPSTKKSIYVSGAWWMLLLVCLVLAFTAFAPLLPVDWWWVRIGDFPRVQLLVSYMIVLLGMIPFRRRVTAKVMASVLLISIGIQLFWIFPYLPIAPYEVEWSQSQDKQWRLRILTANVLQENNNASALLNLIKQEDPDVVVLCEVNDRWIADLAPLEEWFAFHLTYPLDNTYGIALYTKLEVHTAEVRGVIKKEIPSIDARLSIPSGQEVRLFAIHPNPPRPGEDTTKRDGELVLVGREVQNDQSTIVLGDLNDVGWSRTTNLFQEVSGLLDPRKGRGLFPTYNAKSLIWRYPLDYLFHSEDFRVVKLRTLPNIGSDHFPLLVELSYEPSAVATQEAPDLDAGDREDADDAVEAAKKTNKAQ